MSRLHRHAVSLAAGLAAALAAFTVVALTTDGDGHRASPTRQTVASPVEPAPAAPAPAPAPGGHADGRLVFARMGCGSCHRLAAVGSEGKIGPDLDARLPHHTRKSLTAQILSPSRPAFGMPTDFGERMNDAELRALVDFLLATRDPR
jgi:cytochrome c5